MKKTQKNILGILAIICLVLGTIGIFPTLTNKLYILAGICVLLILAGLILLAVIFGD